MTETTDARLTPAQRKLVGTVVNWVRTLTEIQSNIAADVRAEGHDPADPEIKARLQVVVAMVRDDLSPADRDRFDRMIRNLHEQIAAAEPAA